MESEFQKLLSTQIVPISKPQDFAVPAAEGAKLVSRFSHYDMSATELVHMVLSDEIITTFFVTPMNLSMERKNPDKHQRKHHQHAVSIDDIRRTIILHFVNELPAAKGEKKSTQKKLDSLPTLQTINRYEFIHPRLGTAATNREYLSYQIHLNICEIWRPGTDLVFDETMIPYSGRDMIFSGNQKFIPRKPHPFGLLFWGGATRASRCGLPFLFCWIPRYDTNKPTPTDAIIRGVRMGVSWAHQHGSLIRVVCDAGFSSASIIPICRSYNVDVTCSLSNNNRGPLPEVYDLVAEELTDYQCRTLLADGLIYSARISDSHLNVVVSTIAKVDYQRISAGKLAYKQAVALALLIPIDYFKFHFSDDLGLMGSCYEYGCALCGMDIALPKPNNEGIIVLSRLSLSKMFLPQLNWLCDKFGIHGTSVRKTEKVENIIQWLSKSVKQIPDSCRLILEAPHLYDSQISEARKPLRGDPTFSAPHVDYYTSVYFFQDHFNRAFFINNQTASCKKADGVLVYQILYNALYACYVAKLEHMLDKAKEKEEQDNIKAYYTWNEFLFDLAADFIPRPTHRPEHEEQDLSALVIPLPLLHKEMMNLYKGDHLQPLPDYTMFTKTAARATVQEMSDQIQRPISDMSSHKVFQNIRFILPGDDENIGQDALIPHRQTLHEESSQNQQISNEDDIVDHSNSDTSSHMDTLETLPSCDTIIPQVSQPDSHLRQLTGSLRNYGEQFGRK